MTNEPMDDTFRELQAELAVNPSPDFAAKVRARVAVQPARSWFGVWQIATATVALAGVVLAVVVWSRGAPPAVAPAVAPMTSIESAPSPVVALPARKAVTTVARAVPSREAEVLVPPDQRIALAQLLGAMRNRGTEVPALVAGEVDSEGRLPAPAAISVTPITITPLGPPMPGGGSRER